MDSTDRVAAANLRVIRWLTYLMFFMFAMTTDSVGLIIPEVIAEFHLPMTMAGGLQYGSMLGIAGAAIGLGFLADRIGRKRTILTGLALFAATAYLFPAARSFANILVLIVLAGAAIGIFKTGALALVGDMSQSAVELTSTMNMVEGFFGVGAIVGPLLVTQLKDDGVSWRWLYVVAGGLCTVLFVIALRARYPVSVRPASDSRNLASTLRLVPNRYALGFSIAAFCYVAVECAIYVWMPTLLAGYRGAGAALAGYALPAFFVMRAAGRFLGARLLHYVDWSGALVICGVAIFACFGGSVAGGVGVALYLLPIAGIFMSIVYPTINSKGIGCFPTSDHGAVSGIILFFTCAGAFLGPLTMGLVSDAFGGARYGFVFATGIAGLLAALFLVNWLIKPAHAQLGRFAGAPTPA
ncbi:MAG: MFS transporter [Pseudomonadota bacterium]|nr:MFS transporter [Pseudomonadota bacterium]